MLPLELYSSYHKQSIILDFSEINLNKNCKIKKFLMINFKTFMQKQFVNKLLVFFILSYL